MSEIVNLPISSLTINNYRRHTDACIGRLALSIRRNGQRTPITVYENGAPDQYIVWSGEGRLQAVKRLGWKKIAAVIVPKPLGEAERIVGQMTDNDREPADPITEAQAIKDMLGFGKDEQWVAGQLGRPPLWVRNRLALLGLPDALQRKVAAGDLSPDAALKLKGKPEVAARVAATEGRVTVKAVKEAIASAEAKSEPARLAEDYDALLVRLNDALQAVCDAKGVQAQADVINQARIAVALDGIRKESCEEA